MWLQLGATDVDRDWWLWLDQCQGSLTYFPCLFIAQQLLSKFFHIVLYRAIILGIPEHLSNPRLTAFFVYLFIRIFRYWFIWYLLMLPLCSFAKLRIIFAPNVLTHYFVKQRTRRYHLHTCILLINIWYGVWTTSKRKELQICGISQTWEPKHLRWVQRIA